MTSPPLQLRCRDLAAYEDLCIDLGIPAGAFGHHDWDDLDPEERCYCAVARLPREGWDAEARMEHNRCCHDRTTIRGEGFNLILCCRCTSKSEADDGVLAEVGRRVTAAERERASAPVSPDESLCFALATSLDLVLAGHPIQAVNRAGRALREGA